MLSQHIRLRHVPGCYGVARLAPNSPIPHWCDGPGLVALVRTDDELTVVCATDRIPVDVKSDGPWSCLRSIGPFEFQAAGIVQSLVNPLSNAGIGVFVLCTFDGEHLLVSSDDIESAESLLIEAGHRFV